MPDDNNQDDSVIGRYNAGDNTGTANDKTGANQFLETIPEAYREKPYMQDITSMDDLVKKLDGAESLIGKTGRILIPKDDASEDEINSFYKSLGRPDSQDGYKSPFESESKLFDKLKGTFFKNGLTQKQVEGIAKDADTVFSELASQQDQSVADRDREFANMMNSTFGSRKEEAISNARNMLNKFAPEKVRSFMNDLGNKELLLLTSVLDSIHKQQFSEDGDAFDTKGMETTSSVVELEKELDELITKSQDDKKYSHAQRKQFSDRANEVLSQISKLKK